MPALLDAIHLRTWENEDLWQGPSTNALPRVRAYAWIDFDDLANNSFHVVTELTCKNGDDEFRPDITLLSTVCP